MILILERFAFFEVRRLTCAQTVPGNRVELGRGQPIAERGHVRIRIDLFRILNPAPEGRGIVFGAFVGRPA